MVGEKTRMICVVLSKIILPCYNYRDLKFSRRQRSRSSLQLLQEERLKRRSVYYTFLNLRNEVETIVYRYLGGVEVEQRKAQRENELQGSV